MPSTNTGSGYVSLVILMYTYEDLAHLDRVTKETPCADLHGCGDKRHHGTVHAIGEPTYPKWSSYGYMSEAVNTNQERHSFHEKLLLCFHVNESNRLGKSHKTII